jgi:hypothetical protein
VKQRAPHPRAWGASVPGAPALRAGGGAGGVRRRRRRARRADGSAWVRSCGRPPRAPAEHMAPTHRANPALLRSQGAPDARPVARRHGDLGRGAAGGGARRAGRGVAPGAGAAAAAACSLGGGAQCSARPNTSRPAPRPTRLQFPQPTNPTQPQLTEFDRDPSFGACRGANPTKARHATLGGAARGARGRAAAAAAARPAGIAGAGAGGGHAGRRRAPAAVMRCCRRSAAHTPPANAAHTLPCGPPGRPTEKGARLMQAPLHPPSHALQPLRPPRPAAARRSGPSATRRRRCTRPRCPRCSFCPASYASSTSCASNHT